MADRIGRPRVGAALRSIAFAGSIALAAGGCAMVSASGTVYETRIPQAGGGQDQGYPQLIPVGPGNGWTASQIVNGFLAAADNYAVARMYLTQSEGASWHPGGAVTVVGDLKPSSTTSEPKLQPDQPEQVTSVSLSGSQLATLTGSGQYLASRSPSSASRRTLTFWLIKIDNNWRITQLPTSQLMLTPDELEQVYQQRDLYFLDLSGHVLVPDPVFVPQNDTNGDLATQLVTGLLKNPQGWLSEAARTALPAGTSLHGSVSINSTDATVSLSVPRAAAKTLNKRALIAQLVWTLTSISFGPTAIQSVQVQINDRTLTLNGTPYQLPKLYQNWVPGQSAAAGPYFLSHNGSVKAASAAGQPAPGPDSGGMLPASPVPGQAGTAGIPSLSSIAVEPDQAVLAGLSRDGKTVYTAGLTRNAVLTAQQLGGTYTSLSWDRNGDLWVAGGTSVWMLAPGTGSAVEISLTDLPAGDNVTSFRVAPDGVRVAMVVENKGEYQVLLGAIINHPPVASIGSQLVAIGAASSYPQSLSWYDADHIIVLTRPGPNAHLTEVPLNGGTFAQPTPIGTVSGTTSVTSDGAGLAVGLSDGELFVSRNLNGPWQQVASSGRDPVYPG